MPHKNSKHKFVIPSWAIAFVLWYATSQSVNLLPLAFASTGTEGTYTANFTLTENPISGGGKWINGGTVGLDWNNVQTTSGMAFGAETGTNSGNAIYDDSTAVLVGTWGPDQTLQATVHVVPHTQSTSEEVELRLHTSISAHSINGYEVNFAVGGNAGHTYTEIVRWNGALGNFTVLSHQNTGGGVVDGDVIKATMIGNVISVYKNGVQVNTATDGAYTSGQPGMGFYLLGSGVNSTYGFSSFTASDGSTPQLQGTYTTNFPLTENPISESGKWINGGATGLDWNNVYTSGGFAGGVGPALVAYSDPIAILSGTWGPNQSVSATVYVGTASSSHYQEVELHLRTTITAHSITGYEIDCAVTGSHTYLQIVRWNGALGNFTYIESSDTTHSCGNGDVLSAGITGSTINVYLNGSLVDTATDSTYSSGAPGIGFDYGCDSTYANFGFSNFTASDGTTAPSPPTNLSAIVN